MMRIPRYSEIESYYGVLENGGFLSSITTLLPPPPNLGIGEEYRFLFSFHHSNRPAPSFSPSNLPCPGKPMNLGKKIPRSMPNMVLGKTGNEEVTMIVALLQA